MYHNLKPILLGIISALLLFVLAGHIKKVNFVNRSIAFNLHEKDLPVGLVRNASQLDKPTESNAASDFSALVNSISQKSGTYSVYIKNLSTNEILLHNPNEIYYGASLYKVPIALAVLHEIYVGAIDADKTIEYLPEDFSDGSGTIPRDQYNVEYSVSDLLSKLLKDSDNSAQLMLTRSISSSSINQSFSVASPSTNTKLYELNEGTAEDYAYVYNYLFLTALNRNEDSFIGQKNALHILGLMKNTSFEDRISTGFVDSDFSHKIGNWGDTGSWHDCGLAYTKDLHIVCMMSKNTTYEDVVEVGRLVGEFIEN